ncbi:hypothetical protein [Azospirillum sp. TSO35-2]|uniref:hypothetical protein n=1 Tax=Azospirillum sp. TSO35-2 TaxID=716796 RepID=UPI000D60F105|nr:hypothetical protein [Azospirillum sp. TSO35-2]PWC38993.1 hypothetical protein TSO352_01725 [Azospirillum sp. TSO35-2]
MDRRDIWMKDPELKAAYEALGPKFRREVEMAQQRRDPRSLQGAAIASRAARPHTTTHSAAGAQGRPHSGAARR